MFLVFKNRFCDSFKNRDSYGGTYHEQGFTATVCEIMRHEVAGRYASRFAYGVQLNAAADTYSRLLSDKGSNRGDFYTLDGEGPFWLMGPRRCSRKLQTIWCRKQGRSSFITVPRLTVEGQVSKKRPNLVYRTLSEQLMRPDCCAEDYPAETF